MPLHLFLAHFPVVLLVVGATTDLAGAAIGSALVRRVAGALLIGGSVAALLAFFTGMGALSAALARFPAGNSTLDAHAQWGGAGVWLVVGAGAVRAVWRDRLQGPQGWITLALGVLAAALAVAIGLSGMAIAHHAVP